jgi:hypothetical protein
VAIGAEWHEMVRLWAACRGESGIAHWPDAGGVGDQAEWIVDAFATLSAADATMRDHDRRMRGRE